MIGREVSRIARIGLAVIVLVGLLTVRNLSVPSTTVACSCVPWGDTLAAYRTEENVRILAGTVVALRDQRGMFGIERVFKGPVTGPAMEIDGGDAGMCGFQLKLGMRLVLSTWTEGGVLQPSSCMPSAMLDTPEGAKLLADAEASYGGGVDPPPGAPMDPTPEPSPVDTGAADSALPMVMLGVVAVVIVLFGGLALLARRPAKRPEA